MGRFFPYSDIVQLETATRLSSRRSLTCCLYVVLGSLPTPCEAETREAETEDGETIGYNPVDGLLYHASGIAFVQVQTIPEPGTLALFGLGLARLPAVRYWGTINPSNVETRLGQHPKVLEAQQVP